jgi:hypothetical protein
VRLPDAKWDASTPTSLPSGLELAHFLANEAEFPSTDPHDRDDLAKVSSYYADIGGRRPLRERLREVLNHPYQSGSQRRVEEQARAEAQARVATRLRRLVQILSVASILMVVSAVGAAWQAWHAHQESQEAAQQTSLAETARQNDARQRMKADELRAAAEAALAAAAAARERTPASEPRSLAGQRTGTPFPAPAHRSSHNAAARLPKSKLWLGLKFFTYGCHDAVCMLELVYT